MTHPDAPWWEHASTSALLRAAWRAYGDVVRTALSDAGFDDLPRNGAYVVGATAKAALTVQQLPGALGVTKQAFSQLTDMLVLRGYVERETDPADRRRLVLHLTERGREVADLVDECVRRCDAAVAEVVGAESVAQTRRVLAAMTDLPADLGVPG